MSTITFLQEDRIHGLVNDEPIITPGEYIITSGEHIVAPGEYIIISGEYIITSGEYIVEDSPVSHYFNVVCLKL